MANRQREFIVGLFSIIGLIGLLILTVQIKGTPLFEGSYRLDVRFGEVAGSLTRGGSILVYGVKVGEVLDIRIDPDLENYPNEPVVVEMRVRESMTLYENAEVQILESAIIGETKVIVTPGSPPSPPLHDGSILIGTDPGDIFGDIREVAPEIMFEIAESVRIVNTFLRDLNREGQLREAITDLASIINAVEESLAGGEGDFTSTIHNIRDFTDHLNQSLALFDESIVGARDEIRLLRLEVTDALDTFHLNTYDRLVQAGEILERVDNTAATIDSLATEVAPEWREISENLARTTESLDSILTRLDSGEGALGRLLTDEALHDELLQVLDSVNRWLSEIDTLLSGAKEPREERMIPYESVSPSTPQGGDAQ